MTTKSLTPQINEHLRKKVYPAARTVEQKAYDLVCETERVEAEAAEIEAMFKTFSELMVEFLAQFFSLAAKNREVRRILQESNITTKVANAIMVVENLDLLNQVDYILIARQITLIQNKEVIAQAVREIVSQGGDGRERLEWLAEALKQNGY